MNFRDRVIFFYDSLSGGDKKMAYDCQMRFKLSSSNLSINTCQALAPQTIKTAPELFLLSKNLWSMKGASLRGRKQSFVLPSAYQTNRS